MTDAVWAALRGVDDPEYPGVSIVELGLVERVAVDGDVVEVDLVPTFSGCPALAMIADDVRAAVDALEGSASRRPLRPDARSGRRNASRPPAVTPSPRSSPSPWPSLDRPVACPRCGTPALSEESMFGSTRCRSIRRCGSCGEAIETIR